MRESDGLGGTLPGKRTAELVIDVLQDPTDYKAFERAVTPAALAFCLPS